MVCRLLGWDASAFGERICVSAILLGELAAGEFVLFVFEREMCPWAISKYFGD
jgi:hypothetical protein